MKTFKTTGQHKVLVKMLVMFVIASLVPSVSLAELITLRSGQVGFGVPGTVPTVDDTGDIDHVITYLAGGPVFELSGSSFIGVDFSNARNGSPAELIIPSNGAATLSGARWINHNHGTIDSFGRGSGEPPASVLYAHPFMVDTTDILSASIDFYWAVDDRLGDQAPGGGHNPIGVYINETPLSTDFRGGGGPVSVTNASQSGIESMLIADSENWLYVYQRDMAAVVSGVIYSAVIDITPVPEPTTIALLGLGGLLLRRRKSA